MRVLTLVSVARFQLGESGSTNVLARVAARGRLFLSFSLLFFHPFFILFVR